MSFSLDGKSTPTATVIASSTATSAANRTSANATTSASPSSSASSSLSSPLSRCHRDELREQLAVLLARERKHNLQGTRSFSSWYADYLSQSTPHRRSWKEVDLVQDLLAECASLVTDPACYDNDNSRHAIARSSCKLLHSSHGMSSPTSVKASELLKPFESESSFQSIMEEVRSHEQRPQRQSAGLHPQWHLKGDELELVRKDDAMSLMSFWRRQMLDWACMVADTYQLDHLLVACSFQLLDQFMTRHLGDSSTRMQSQAKQITRDAFQLYSMTCLYIAIKAHETSQRRIGLDAFVTMSRGYYTSQDIVTAELEILCTLQWQVVLQAPTAHEYTRLLWQFFCMSPSLEVQAASAIILDTAMADGAFSLVASSSLIAVAAVLLAARAGNMPDFVIQQFATYALDGLISIECNLELGAIYYHLEKIYYDRDDL